MHASTPCFMCPCSMPSMHAYAPRSMCPCPMCPCSMSVCCPCVPCCMRPCCMCPHTHTATPHTPTRPSPHADVGVREHPVRVVSHRGYPWRWHARTVLAVFCVGPKESTAFLGGRRLSGLSAICHSQGARGGQVHEGGRCVEITRWHPFQDPCTGAWSCSALRLVCWPSFASG